MMSLAPYIFWGVEMRTGFSEREIKSRSRKRGLAWARHDAMYEFAKRTDLSLGQIAKKVGRADHTTVIHGIRQHCKRNQLEAPR